MQRYELPAKPTLIVDSREKLPFDFEGDDDFAGIEYRKLDSGDYSLVGMQDIITIERKKSVDELYNNLAKKKDVERFVRELKRMPPYRFMIVEASWEDILNPKSYYVNGLPARDKRRPRSPYQPRAIIMAHFFDFYADHGLNIIPAGMHAQSMTKRLLLHFYQLHRKGKLGSQNQQEA